MSSILGALYFFTMSQEVPCDRSVFAFLRASLLHLPLALQHMAKSRRRRRCHPRHQANRRTDAFSLSATALFAMGSTDEDKARWRRP